MPAVQRLFSKKDIIKLVLPLLVELSLTLMVGMIDSIMVSSAGEAAVSGVSLIDTVFQLLIYIFTAFGTGGAVIAGQYLGAKQQKEAKETAGQLVWFSGLVSISIMALIYLIRPLLLTVVFGSITEEVFYNANRYLILVAMSIPALSVYESGAAIFRTMGNAKITMWIAVIMNTMNCIGNALFIYLCGLGTAGAALATAISRYAAAVLTVVLLLRENQELSLERSLKYRPNCSLIKKILAIGIPNGVENGLFQAGKIILASLVTGFGTSAITANAICQMIANIQVIPGNAFALTDTTVIARCVGAQDENQTKYFNRLLILMAYVVLILFCMLTWIALPVVLPWYHLSEATSILTRQMLLVHTVGTMMIWPLTFVLPSSLRAAGDVKYAMFISISSMWLFRVMAAYLLSNRMGIGALGVWVAMLLDWGFRGAAFSCRWLKGKWKEHRSI